MNNTLCVCIVDDDTEARVTLEQRLDEKRIGVITFASAEELLESDEFDRIGCFVLNVELRKVSGLDLQAKLRRQLSPAPTVVTSGDAVVRDAIRAFEEGASAFFEKPYDDRLLADAVHELLTAECERRRIVDDRNHRLATLSERECDVAERLILGRSIKTIARELGISPSTAEKHRTSILQKTRIDTVVELTRLMTLELASPSQHAVRRGRVACRAGSVASGRK